MRILLVNDYGIPVGGAELGLRTLRGALQSRGHEARLFASLAGAEKLPYFGDDACFGTTSRWRGLVQTWNPWARRALQQALRTYQPDVVHVRMFLTQLSPAILGALRDVPALLDVVWYRPVCPTGLKLLPSGRPCRVSYGSACLHEGCLPLHDWLPLMVQMHWWRRNRDVFDLVVAKSQDVRRRLLEAGIEPVELLWDGVPERSPRPVLSDPPVVGFAGRLVPEKGVDVLLRAFAIVVARHPAARLIVVGDGPSRRELERLAKELGIVNGVEWTGKLTQSEMERRLDAAWVQVVPSRWAEPFGLVAIEAMMRGTLAVVTPAGGLGEIVVDGETGLHVPPDDAASLAAALTRLLGNRPLVERMGAAARERALAHFTKESYVDRLVMMYERMIASAGSAA